MLDKKIELEWPSKKDRLFDQTEGDQTSLVSFSRGNDIIFAESYLESAELLLDDAAKRYQLADLRIIPALFLYRQHLELLLKGIIKAGTGKDSNKTHDLDILWTQCIGVYKTMGMAGYDQENKSVARLLAEFTVIDKESDGLRFPRLKDGQDSLQFLDRVNIPNLKRVMRKLSFFLYGFLDHVRENNRREFFKAAGD